MAIGSQRTSGWKIGKAFGAPIILSPATLLMILLLAYLWSAQDGLTAASITRGLILAVLLFTSVFAHEAAHAAAASAFGRRVDEIALTLFGGHTKFESQGLTPLAAGVIAVAGPAANVVIGVVAVIAAPFLPGEVGSYVSWLGWANMILAIFNLLPGLPMDGGRLTEAIVWGVSGSRYRGTVVAAWLGLAVAVLVPLGYLGVMLAIGSRPDLLSAIWLMLIAGLLWQGAYGALVVARAEQRIASASAATLMAPAVGVGHDSTVAEALAQAASSGASHVVVLAADGAPGAHFSVASAQEVPEALRAQTPVSAVSLPLPRGATVAAEAVGTPLFDSAREWWGKADVLAVTHGGAVVGALELAAVARHLRGGRAPRRA